MILPHYKSTIIWLRYVTAILTVIFFTTDTLHGESLWPYDKKPVIAVGTNMLYDAAFTPDLKLELCANSRVSFVAEGVWAWWSRHQRNRCWRIYGGWFEARWWMGQRPLSRALTGCHIGLYGSFHSYDFEFGHRG